MAHSAYDLGVSLRANLVAAVVTAISALVLTVLLLEDPLVEHRETVRTREALHVAALEVVAALSRGEDPDAVADRVGAERACRVQVVDARGRLVGDTAYGGDLLAARPSPVEEIEVVEARQQGMGFAVHRASEGDYHLLALALVGSGGTVVRIVRPQATLDAGRASQRDLLLVGGVIAVVAGMLLMVVLSRTMVRPIDEVTRVAHALADGDLSARTRSQRSDELGTLGRALDRMAEQLDDRVAAVRAEEARLRTVLDSMVEAVFVTDAGGRIVLHNRSLEALAGGEVRGRTPVEAVRSGALYDAVRGASKTGPQTVALELLREGRRRHLEAHVAPLPDGAGVVVVLHDVTERQRIDRVRRDFVANASHELRTPLTAIRGFAETLAGDAGADPATRERFLATILKHSERLERLVDDLVALARAESPEDVLELASIDLLAVATEVLEGLGQKAASKRIVLRLEGEVVRAWANESAVDQVLVNLIDNAIKYTPETGRVTIGLRQTADRAVIEVTDTGGGIDEKHRVRIFERFYRVDKGRARDVGGTGLGLAIVKHLVQRMGGEVELDSELGKGSCFRVLLPLPTAPDSAT